MAKRNGGIIGPSNVPTGQYGGVAPGVWRLRDAFNYIKAGLWPVAGTYPVGNSARFNSGSSDYLSRTPSVTGNRQKWTYSVWIKRSRLSPGSGEAHQLLSASPSGSGGVEQIFLTENNVLNYFYADPSVRINLVSSAVFRDVSAWYHIVVAVDTTQATNTNRVKIYVNGSQITFSTAQYPDQNQNTYINNTNLTSIGSQINNGSDNGNYFGGYMSEINFINDQQLTPSSFGLTDSATGIWIPKPYTGTYGTNGFYLKFANSASLGTDSSGNGNNLTVNNLTSVDQSTDTPTNNFCTINPLDTQVGTTVAFAEGNLQITPSASATCPTRSTIAVDKGKWYWEVKVVSSTSQQAMIGIADVTSSVVNSGSIIGGDAKSYGYYAGTGEKYNNNSGAAYGATYTNGDIIGVALNMDSGTLVFYKNGTTQGTAFSSLSGFFSPAFSDGGGGSAPEVILQTNFGSPPYAANSYADAAGFGNFSYAVPSGYYALCTKNLATYG